MIECCAYYLYAIRFLLIKIFAILYQRGRFEWRNISRIFEDNITKALKLAHRECDLKVTCISLIRIECSVIFVVLKHVRTLVKVQRRRAYKCI